ncbi:MAG: hypothetical protein NT078_01035 [Candidatus Azambacteria bacterium]|nr:hypothetical protein [Candidatus Azambacteria bacterium]
MQLNSKALGLTVGVVSGAFWLVAMLFSLLTSFGEQTLTTWGSWHPFFSYSLAGMIVIVIEHLVVGFIAGWIFATVYNKFNKPSAV